MTLAGRGVRLPVFLQEIVEDPARRSRLVAAALALGAAGLNPQVTSPALSTVQAAIREQPQINGLLLLATLASAGLLFVGGILGDTNGRRTVLLGALVVLGGANLADLVIADGALFVITRVAAAAAAYAVLPFSLALVATTYSGVARATAIGIVYAAYGGGAAAAPVLLTILGPTGPWWPGFLATAIVAGIALWWCWSRVPDLAAAAKADRAFVVSTALWAFAIVVITAGAVDVGNRVASPIRIGLIAFGVALVIVSAAWTRARRLAGSPETHVSRRPVTVAIAVGVVLGLAQAAPLFQLPLFLRAVLGYGVIVATVATAPFIVALVAAGPVAGALISRFRPRDLVAAGLGAVGLGNVLTAVVLGRDTPYFSLVAPLVLIGAGFVVGTTVRTAIIFASVSRGLPATAGALNEASILVGSRIGLAALTALITQRALDLYGGSLGAIDPAGREAAVGAFRDVLVAIGSPTMQQVLGLVDPDKLAAYGAAFVEASREGLLATGLIALVAMPIVWVTLGRRDPLATVWDHAEEREPASA
ncbi:MAG TPA: MFS transporter [Candidatus Limnocylindrales bacterium]|nr:MFS transporter [Candidatus Limnocylindrales bacterium]